MRIMTGMNDLREYTVVYNATAAHNNRPVGSERRWLGQLAGVLRYRLTKIALISDRILGRGTVKKRF